jgi:Predicted ATPases
VADYLPSNRVKANLLSNIKAIIRGGKKARLVEIIKLFDSNTLNVEMIDNELYVQLSNLTQLVPVSFIGDGLQRFIGIFAAVLNPDNSVVLIDEIDNGLHYTVLEQLWKSLIDLSIENDTQLFITTHNEESLSSLATVLEEEEEVDLTVFSVQMTKKAGLKAYLYPAKALQGAVEKEIEIR